MAQSEFALLERTFTDPEALPALPAVSLQLMRAIDGGEASVDELEHYLNSDPGLAGEFLRIASASMIGLCGKQFSTIRGAILLLGQLELRALAAHLLMRELMFLENPPKGFNVRLFARHSLSVGLLSRELYSRRIAEGSVRGSWGVEEVFAAGLLSELGTGILARSCKPSFSRVYSFAKRSKKSLNEAFGTIFGESLTKLTARAAETWGFDEVFIQTFQNLNSPEGFEDQYTALACIRAADSLATRWGLTICDWEPAHALPEDLAAEAGLEKLDIETIREDFVDSLEDYLGEEAEAA